MTPPRICPPPPDCPLYAQRLDYGADEPLRRAILMERSRPSLGALVWADFNRQRERAAGVRRGIERPVPGAPPTRPTLPPAAEPLPLPIASHLKGANHE